MTTLAEIEERTAELRKQLERLKTEEDRLGERHWEIEVELYSLAVQRKHLTGPAHEGISFEQDRSGNSPQSADGPQVTPQRQV